MGSTRKGGQQQPEHSQRSRSSHPQAASPTSLLVAARRLGNQRMTQFAMQLASQRAGVPPLPASVREDLERDADLAADAATQADTQREVSPPAQVTSPPGHASVRAQLGGGAPLPSDERARFEAHFRASLGDVRVHVDHAAAREARMLGARAFTRGSHIYFENAADARNDKWLVAHELAHVVQQRHQPSLAAYPLLDDKPEMRAVADLPRYRLKVKVDRALTGDELLVELLRQYFGITDADIARKVIQDEELTLPKGFVVPETSVAQGYHVITVTEEQRLQIELAARKYGVTQPARHDPLVPPNPEEKSKPTKPGPEAAEPSGKKPSSISDELAGALRRHAELMPDQKPLRVPTEDELARLQRINKQLELLTPDQRKLFAQLAEPTDDLELYEESLRSFSEAVAGAEEALQKLAKGKASLPAAGTMAPPSGGQGVGLSTTGATGSTPGSVSGGIGPAGPVPATDAVTVEPTIGPAGPGTTGVFGAQGGAGSTAAKAGAADELQRKLDETWKSVDAKSWGKLDAKSREALARQIAAEQRNIQLKHMVTHPGETVKQMAEGVVRVDKLAKDVAKDVKDIADSSKSVSARAAAAASASKKISMWLSAIVVVATIIAFIINPALALKAWMLRAMALMIVGAALAATEAELRIQEAVGAKDFTSFQAAVQKAASAQAEFIAVVALAAIPLVGRILVKIPIVGRVAGYLGKFSKFTTDKLWLLRNAIAKQLRELVKGSKEAVKAEGAATANLANQLKLMTPEEFLEALKKDKDIREALGFDHASIKSLDELLKTPEGKKVLEQLHKELTRTVEDAPKLAERLIDDYNTRLEEAAQKIENAKTAEEVKAAVDEARRVLGERQAAKDLTAKGEEYKSFRQSEAAEKARLEALEREAEAQRAAEKAAAEKAAAEKAAPEKAAPEKAAPEKAAPEKAAAEKPEAEAKQPKPVEAAPTEKPPLREVKPEDVGAVIKEEAKADTSKRLDWDRAEKLELDPTKVPEGVVKAGLSDLWKEWVDYVHSRVRAKASGARRPLTWEAYRDFLGKFQRGRAFQRRFTKTLEAESAGKAIVEQDVGVVSETLEPAVKAKTEGVKFADQVVTDKAALERFTKGEGPPPEVETFSNKSRDFKWHDEQGTLDSSVRADVAEVLTKYFGKITIRRPGPLQGVKVTVKRATLVYDAAFLPKNLISAVKRAFQAASKGRIELRIE